MTVSYCAELVCDVNSFMIDEHLSADVINIYIQH